MIEIENVDKKEKIKIANVIHRDLDGLTSGAVVVRALWRENLANVENVKNVVFILQDPNDPFQELFANIVIIADVALTPKTWGSLQNIKAEKVVWIDHHKPFVDISTLTVPENVQIILDPTSPSAVKLVQNFFNMHDEISQKIVELGTKADTWQLDPLVQEWMNLDSAYSFKKRDKTPLIERLASGNLEITGKLRRTLESYLKMKEKAKQKLLKNTVVREIKGHSFAVGLSPSVISGSEGAEFLLQATNSEVQIVLKYPGWMSFRRAKNSNINLIPLANIFGGGGHEYASGASLGKHVTSRNFQRIAEEIFSKIAEVL